MTCSSEGGQRPSRYGLTRATRLAAVLGLIATMSVSGCDQVPTAAGPVSEAGAAVGPRFSTSADGTVPVSGTPGISGFAPTQGPYSTNNSTGEGGALFIRNLTTVHGQIYHQDPITGLLFGLATLPPAPFSPFQSTSAPHGTQFCVIAALPLGGEDPNDRGTCYRSLPFGLQTTEEYTAYWTGGVSRRSPSVRKLYFSVSGRTICKSFDGPRYIIRSKPSAGGVRG
jgi:hypothetical protein